MSQIDDNAKVHSQPLVQLAEVPVPQQQPGPAKAMATTNIKSNNSIRVGLGSQHTRKSVAIEPHAHASKQSTTVAKKATQLTAEQKAMIEAKRQAALILRQQKQKINQNQQQTHIQQQVRFNPYAK